MMSADPQIEKQHWLQLASLQVGGAICLPLLLVGYELAKQGNPITMGLSILGGNCLLFGLALIAGWMSSKRSLITVEQAALYFGSNGRSIFAWTVALSMMGWFAIQTQMMGGDLHRLIDSSVLGVGSVSLALGVIIIAGACWGIQFLSWIANLCVPLMLFTIGFAVYDSGSLSGMLEVDHQSASWWDGKGISLVLASSIAATIDLPTFYRHALHHKAMVWASVVNFLIATPLVQLAGMCLYYGTHAETISQALTAESGMIWSVWVVLFMLLAGWTTNNVNLYSASLSLKSLSKKMTFIKAMGLAGVIGIVFLLTPALDQFVVVLDLMGILVVAMGAVMFTGFVLEWLGLSSQPLYAWIAWSVGIIAGLIEVTHPQLGSGAPVLDAGIVSVCTMLIISIVTCIFKKPVEVIKEEI